MANASLSSNSTNNVVCDMCHGTGVISCPNTHSKQTPDVSLNDRHNTPFLNDLIVMTKIGDLDACPVCAVKAENAFRKIIEDAFKEEDL